MAHLNRRGRHHKTRSIGRVAAWVIWITNLVAIAAVVWLYLAR